MIILILGWVLAIPLVLILVGVVYAIGLHGLRKDQRAEDPLNKESNFWW